MNSDSALLRAVARYVISTGSEAARCRNEIRKLLDTPAPAPAFSGFFEADAERVLADIGAPAKLVGFRYCVKAIAIVAKEPIRSRKFSDICREVSKDSNVKSDAVRVSIGHLADVVCERSTVETLVEYFGNSIDWDTGKVTPHEFVYRLAAYIRQRA